VAVLRAFGKVCSAATQAWASSLCSMARYTVVGLMPPDFPAGAEQLWVPMAFTDREFDEQRGRHFLRSSPVKANVTPAPGFGRTRSVNARVSNCKYPDRNKSCQRRRLPPRNNTSGGGRVLICLLGAVACVLLIAASMWRACRSPAAQARRQRDRGERGPRRRRRTAHRPMLAESLSIGARRRRIGNRPRLTACSDSQFHIIHANLQRRPIYRINGRCSAYRSSSVDHGPLL